MKTVIALKSFSTGQISMSKGEVRELVDATANQFISEGLAKLYFEPDDVNITPILTEGTDIATATINGEEVTIKAPAGGGGGSSELFPITATWNDDWSTATLNKTFSEIKTALESGLFPYITNNTEIGGNYYFEVYSLEQLESNENGWLAIITIVDTGAGSLNVYEMTGATLSDYPTYNA
jgi:hypothetical protein